MSAERNICPLSSSEMGIYLAHPETTAYNLPYFLPLWDDVDLAKLKAALTELLDVHPHAYMRICVDDEGNVGKYTEKFEFDLPLVKAKSLDEFKSVPFTVQDAPLFRFAVYEVKGRKFLLLEFHHIVIDGTGIGILVNDLIRLYDGQTISAEDCTAEQFTEKEIAQRQSKEFENAKAYYEKTFGGL